MADNVVLDVESQDVPVSLVRGDHDDPCGFRPILSRTSFQIAEKELVESLRWSNLVYFFYVFQLILSNDSPVQAHE